MNLLDGDGSAKSMQNIKLDNTSKKNSGADRNLF
jgi:hypothetical protein